MTGHVSPVPREARPYQGLPAGLPSRILANAIDAAVVVAVLVAGYAAVAAALFIWSPSRFEFPTPPAGVLLLLGYLVLIGYFTFAWSATGRTYGDELMGLRVLNHRGERPGRAVSLARAAFCAAFPVGLLWAAVSRDSRSVQDLVLRTSVRYDWQPRPSPAGSVSAAPPSAPR